MEKGIFREATCSAHLPLLEENHRAIGQDSRFEISALRRRIVAALFQGGRVQLPQHARWRAMDRRGVVRTSEDKQPVSMNCVGILDVCFLVELGCADQGPGSRLEENRG